MTYVSVITDYTYLLWQQELQVFNFRKLGLLDDLVIVILKEVGVPLSAHALELCEKAPHVFVFENRQPRRHYVPSNKPYGLQKLLEISPGFGKQLFLLDSDVIFREPLDTSKLDQDDVWYVSDSGAIGYLGYHYLKAMLGPEKVDEMARLVGLDAGRLEREQPNSGGAQYLMKGVTADFCKQVVEDCYTIYDWAIQQKRENGTYKIQVWTAEMWAWLWNAFKVAEVRVHREMDFAWAPHHISDWHSKKMLHLAGVTGNEPGCFYKGKYPHRKPWELEPHFDFVSQDRCWWPYVQLIQEYRDHA